MEKILTYIRETSDKRTELEIECAATKVLLEQKIQHKLVIKERDRDKCSSEECPEECVENLRVHLRELEKRCTQQALNYEEALLELEAMRKVNKRKYYKSHSRSNLKNDWLVELLSNYSKSIDVSNCPSSSAMEKYRSSMQMNKVLENKIPCEPMADCSKYLRTIGNRHIPVPVQITIRNCPNKPQIKIIKWKSPGTDKENEDFPISSYHIYLDGDFYKSVGVSESLSALLPDMDEKIHRVSIRSVSSLGQSKDEQCTLEINPICRAPIFLKAYKITSTSAYVSWMPSDSSMSHEVWTNGIKFHDCRPGEYKILVHGLKADTLQRIRVNPSIDQCPDTTTNSTYIDFQTLPVWNETKGKVPMKSSVDDIEAPCNVKLESGNKFGEFLVRWKYPQRPLPPAIKLVGYSILINSQCIALVNGAKNDRFCLKLTDLRGISLTFNSQSFEICRECGLCLTMRTIGTITQTDVITNCTIHSKHSQPPLKITGKIAAAIAGGGPEASLMLGEELSLFINLPYHGAKSNVGTVANWYSCQYLNSSTDYENGESYLPSSNQHSLERKTIPYGSTYISQKNKCLLGVSSKSLCKDMSSYIREIGPQVSYDCSDDSSDSSNSLLCHPYVPSRRTSNIQRRYETDIPDDNVNGFKSNLSFKCKFKNKRSQEDLSNRNSQAKIFVPKIEITKYSNFTGDDKCPSLSPEIITYSNRRINEPDQRAKTHQDISEERQPCNVFFSEMAENSHWHRYYDRDLWTNGNIRYFVALYDYDPLTMSPNRDSASEELQFMAGENLKIFGGADEDGFYRGERNGRQGLVPSNIVKEINKSEISYNNGYRDNKEISIARNITMKSRDIDGESRDCKRNQNKKENLGTRKSSAGGVLRILNPNVDGNIDNDLIAKLNEINVDDCYTSESNGRRGLVPSNLQTEVVAPSDSTENQQRLHNTRKQMTREVSDICVNSCYPNQRTNKDGRNSNGEKSNSNEGHLRDKQDDTNREIDQHAGVRGENIQNTECSSLRMTCDPISKRHSPQFYVTPPTETITLPLESKPLYQEIFITPNRGMDFSAKSHRPTPSMLSEYDDMPIVMDLSPPKENQAGYRTRLPRTMKKKTVPPVSENNNRTNRHMTHGRSEKPD